MCPRWGAPPGSAPYLPQAPYELVLFCGQTPGVTVAHGKVNLAAVTPEPGRVGWEPCRKQPVCKREGATVRNKEGQGQHGETMC